MNGILQALSIDFVVEEGSATRYAISTMKTALILVLVGALVGVSAASFLVPPMLSWYTSPGGLPQGAQIQAVVQIPEVIRYATSKLLWGQTIGGGIGAAMGLLISLLLRRKGHRVTPPRAAGPPASR